MSSSTGSEQQFVDESAPSLALTLLFVGLGYALPMALFPDTYEPLPVYGKGILNLYCLVSWMGLAHFFYAYRGQFLTLQKPGFPWPHFVIGFILGIVGLLGLRTWVGVSLFNFLMWVYFIPHFIRALVHFKNAGNKYSVSTTQPVTPLSMYWFPTLCFVLFTIAVFGLPYVDSAWQGWTVIAMVAAAVGLGYVGNVFKQLQQTSHSPILLLAFVLLAETLIWGAYSPYMHPQFRQGLYIIHVAMASFYHYFRSYAFAQKQGAPSTWLSLKIILMINLGLIVCGHWVLNTSNETMITSVLSRVFDVNWFTFWVGLHQYASDVFNMINARYKVQCQAVKKTEAEPK